MGHKFQKIKKETAYPEQAQKSDTINYLFITRKIALSDHSQM